jgi:hypothetical protein
VEQHCADGGWTDNLLCDVRRMTVGLTLETLRQFTDLITSHLEEPPGGMIAVLTSDSRMCNDACAYAALAREHARLEVFRDEETAATWLGRSA